jgi:peptidoglycan/xylan/chitin deacetylase (PgdA/CDA1 family)
MSLTIIAYHYVRPLPDPRFPGIRGKDLGDFRSQLRSLAEKFVLLRGTDLMDAIQGGAGLEGLPANSALLTFDDGYLDHYAYVAPLLDELRVPGCFFPMGRSVRERRLSEANKIQLLLKGNPEALWEEAKAAWMRHGALPEPAASIPALRFAPRIGDKTAAPAGKAGRRAPRGAGRSV